MEHATRWAVGGLIAGFIFVILEMMLVPLALGGPLWGPPRMMAAIGLGKDVLPPPATFDFGIVMVGMLIHFVLSALYGVLIGALTARRPIGVALAIGGAIGLGLYLFNFYVMTAAFPWFANARNWVTIFAHVVFGAVAAWYAVRAYAGRSFVAPATES